MTLLSASPEHQEAEAGEHGDGDGGQDDGVGMSRDQLPPSVTSDMSVSGWSLK